ncbi:MAG TPA: hypothetical protein VGG61_10655 [Gemmataceae bacterium]|jgi:hypothetical protein
MVKLIIRGFVDGMKKFEEHVEVDSEDFGVAKVYALAARHMAVLGNEPHMIEFEFPDEPDPLKRFFRFGTDPRGMVIPVVVEAS